jgi:hypothetical protein
MANSLREFNSHVLARYTVKAFLQRTIALR